MITHKMKSLAVDLQGALGGKDGLAINNALIALIVEMGGNEMIAKQLVTPIQQMVYLQTLLIQHIPTLSLMQHEQAPGVSESPGSTMDYGGGGDATIASTAEIAAALDKSDATKRTDPPGTSLL